MASPTLDYSRLDPSRYDLEKIRDSLELQKTFRMFYEPYKSQTLDPDNAKQFLSLITWNNEFFDIAFMEIGDLRDNNPEWTKDDNSNMQDLFVRTKILRPLPDHVFAGFSELEIGTSTYASEMLSVLRLGRQGAPLSPDTVALATFAGDALEELLDPEQPRRLRNDRELLDLIAEFNSHELSGDQEALDAEEARHSHSSILPNGSGPPSHARSSSVGVVDQQAGYPISASNQGGE